MTILDVGQTDVSGYQPEQSAGRLEWVAGLIEQRKTELDAQAKADDVPPSAVKHVGPAFVVHAYEVGRLLGDDECRAYLETIARDGGRCGVVVRVHGPVDEVATAFAEARSALLAAALVDGRTFQMAHEADSSPPVGGGPSPAATLGVRIANAVLHLPDALPSIVRHHIGADGSVDRAAFAEGLRRAADRLAPAEPIRCPLCMASPMLRPSEVESHLVSTHAASAEGVRGALG